MDVHLRSARWIGRFDETLEIFESRRRRNRTAEDEGAVRPLQQADAVETCICGNPRLENLGTTPGLSLKVLKRKNAEEIDRDNRGKKDRPKPEALSSVVLHDVGWHSVHGVREATPNI